MQARTVLNQHEQERYLVLDSLTTDTGRGRAWLRWAGRAELGWRREGRKEERTVKEERREVKRNDKMR